MPLSLLHLSCYPKNAAGYSFDWALEARQRMSQYILNGNHDRLIDFRNQGKAFDLAVPSPDHYLPPCMRLR